MMDERFVVHRYRATRFAAVVAALVAALFFFYALFVEKTIRWDLLIILTAMAVSKVAALAYLRRTN
jgi:hypothetical protein